MILNTHAQPKLWVSFFSLDLHSPAYRLGSRLRQILNLLIQGQPRKEISSLLGVSIHTVNGYCKELYEKFNIHSQAELVHRFAHGDGGDHPANPPTRPTTLTP
jgi:DNA-binding CsgD family transcriptional regulator